MRIVAGRLKGRRLGSPRWDGLRPTSDRLRETLFNILGDRPHDARVLDACAGTGAVGREAISRGAAHVIFVDDDKRATSLIAKNLAHCGAGSHGTVVTAALPAAVALPAMVAPFDLVLLDPPYDDHGIDVILSAVAARLKAEGLLVFERSIRRPQFVPLGLEAVKTVTSGESALDFFLRSRNTRSSVTKETDGDEVSLCRPENPA